MAAREINDGQPTMAEGDVRINKQAGVIGAAMSEGIAHADDRRGVKATR
jgi:hypothetical protein